MWKYKHRDISRLYIIAIEARVYLHQKDLFLPSLPLVVERVVERSYDRVSKLIGML
jgi:hypothetical protein